MSQISNAQPKESRTISLQPEITPGNKSTRVLFNVPNGKLVLVSLPAGYEWQEHATPNHALVQVLYGNCEFFFGPEKLNLGPGDLLKMGPNEVHYVRAFQEPVTLLLTLFKPTR